MEIFQAKGQLNYQSNLTQRKKIEFLDHIGAVPDPVRTKGVAVSAIETTEKLTYINAIEEQNKKLREISWIQSHVVRSPLARIMGLVQLINEKDNKDMETILEYIRLSAHELDNAIREITDKSAQVLI